MPSLETLNLASISLRPKSRWVRRYRDWFHVFDAIRDHPRALQLKLDVINFDGYNLNSFCHNTGDFEKYLQQKPSDDRVEAGKRSLALYLSGKTELDDTMRLWFDRDDSPDES